MGAQKIIAAIGVSEEATAHLRLLIRKVAASLNHSWRWGTEVNADLIVVDVTNFAGQMGRTRAQAGGIPCAVVCDPERLEREGLILVRPFKPESVIAVLNQAAQSTVSTAPVAGHGDDFYFRELEEFKVAPSGEPAESHDHWGDRRASAPIPMGIDEMIKGDPLLEPAPEAPAIKLGDDTTIAPTDGKSARADRRLAELPESMLAGVAKTDTRTQPGMKRSTLPDTTRRPLSAYLEGTLINAPSRIKIDGAPALVLDPKNQVFYCEGTVDQLTPLLRDPPMLEAWRPVTSSELASVRESSKPQPYAHLRWLEALLKSNGRLASHLDPGGSYLLLQMVPVSPDFHAHRRIAAAMNKHARLNEITADSGAPMEQVFDLVNAYDAIGAIEWRSRQRLRAEAEAPPEPKSKGLIGKLRWPFGKG